MSKLNFEFFECYKQFDKACSNLLGVKNGATEYINILKKNSKNGYGKYLKSLIELRHKRNHLAHEGSFAKPLCSTGDIKLIKKYTLAVLNGTDPVSKFLHKKQKAKLIAFTVFIFVFLIIVFYLLNK